MDKYLLELLKEVNTIIIPGLGALTITNADTGEIMFMPYLKHDDGKLSGFIAEREAMSENDAKNLIAKYVREIQAKLDQGESYDMFQFGSFYKNDAGDVDFKNWDGTASIEERGMEEEIGSEKEVVSVKVEEERGKEEEIQAVPVVEEVKEELPPVKEEKIEPVEEKIVKEEKVTPIVENKSKEMNIAEKEELGKNVEKLKKLKEDQKVQKVKRKKKGAGFWMLMVLIVLICAGGTYVIFDYDNFKQHIPFLADKGQDKEEISEIDQMKKMMGVDQEEETTESEEPEQAEGNEIQEETAEESVTEQPEQHTEVVQEEVKKEVVKEPKPVINASSSGSFHVIAGAFASPENAQRLAETLKQQGYPVIVGTANGLNMVSIRSFATQQEAEAALPELRSAAPKAWVFNGNL